MARFGIAIDDALGIPVKWLREQASILGKDHQLAQQLWGSGIHEARILASIVDEPSKVDRDQLEDWAAQFHSWDLCDQCCSNLFVHTRHVRDLIPDWCSRPEEFVKRAGFVLIAQLAVKDKKASAEEMIGFLDLVRREAKDERNNVKKGVNWALRQMGKREITCHSAALRLAKELSMSKDSTERWVGKDAMRELEREDIQERMRRKKR